MVDYQRLYEEKCRENEISIQCLLDERLRFQTTLGQVRSLHSQLRAVTQEARQKNDQIQAYLGTFLPQFAEKSNKKEAVDEKTTPATCDPQNVDSKGPPVRGLPPEISPKLPLPVLQYEWEEFRPSAYSFLTRASRFPGRVDELKLCLRFDVSSLGLPDKVQLEITDEKTGKVVFKKRQNVYYVKLQERISTLDSGKDYNLQVKSITGPEEETGTHRILSKVHLAASRDERREKKISFSDETAEKPSKLPIEESGKHDADLDSALEEFLEEVRFFEASPLDRKSSDEYTAAVVEQPKLNRVKKTCCVVLQRLLPPDHDKKPHTAVAGPSANALNKAQALPRVRYRWQMGFRKAPNGRYVRRPILRISMHFKERFELLPRCLVLSAHQEDASGKESQVEEETSEALKVTLSGGDCSLELSHLDSDRRHWVSVKPKCGQDLVPNFRLSVDPMMKVEENDFSWKEVEAVVPH